MWSSPLTKVAIVTATGVLGATLWIENRLQHNFRKQDYYQKSLALLHKYEPAADFLGRPIYGGKLDLTDDSKFRVELIKATVCIPLKGPKGKGVLHVLASREKLGDRWDIDLLDLEVLNNKQRWTFYDRRLTQASDHPSHTLETPTDNV
ncbi:unnamed protein product [Candidula unifasciata]|uniref:Cytochrome oxidase complex assembly protein 1 n=1 Tax=Candidula unifasciata TaxID=100452 RepID=A0A8S3YVG6_9EUPU|nr:unnamed protein product [Candidula unifasciata]